MRSPLVWAGAKAWHAPAVRRYWEWAGKPRIVEPFAGGLSISLELETMYSLASDVNPHLMNFYRWLRDGEGQQKRFKERDQDEYLRVRRGFNSSRNFPYHYALPDEMRARAFYYLNRHAFNGLWRVNKKGEFNVPPRSSQGATPSLEKIAETFRAVTAAWTFRNSSWQDLEWEPEDFIYADPPYDDGWTGYAADRFSWSDQVLLAKTLAIHPGPVVLMNKPTERIVALYLSCGFTLEYLAGGQAFQRSRGTLTAVPELMAVRNIDARIL